MQALELEEFRALERQIVKDAGVPVRGSVQSLPQPARRDALSRSRVMDSPTNQLEQGSGTQCVSQTAQPSRQHEQAQCLPPWDQQPASLANLQNTSGASHRNPQASLPRAAQTKRTVSGNPFADAEDLTESPTDLYAEPLSANLANTAQHMQASQYDDWPPASYAAEQVQQQSVPAVAHIEDFWDPAAEHAPVEQQASVCLQCCSGTLLHGSAVTHKLGAKHRASATVM